MAAPVTTQRYYGSITELSSDVTRLTQGLGKFLQPSTIEEKNSDEFLLQLKSYKFAVLKIKNKANRSLDKLGKSIREYTVNLRELLNRITLIEDRMRATSERDRRAEILRELLHSFMWGIAFGAIGRFVVSPLLSKCETLSSPAEAETLTVPREPSKITDMNEVFKQAVKNLGPDAPLQDKFEEANQILKANGHRVKLSLCQNTGETSLAFLPPIIAPPPVIPAPPEIVIPVPPPTLPPRANALKFI